MITRTELLEQASIHVDSGAFFEDLSRLVAYPTESSKPSGAQAIEAYLDEVVVPRLTELGCKVQLFKNWKDTRNTFVIATLVEAEDLPTVLTYGHVDVVAGQDGDWDSRRSPWHLTAEGPRWFARGTADNKGQHLVNLTALKLLRENQGRLGFNLTMLFECGEEIGSPGLAQFAQENHQQLAADLFVASDGPRLDAETPTLFLGNRGGVKFRLKADLRDSAVHSGNWGGLVRNPATTLAAAINRLVDGRGRILEESLLPGEIPDSVRQALSNLHITLLPEDPSIDPDWGHTELTPVERLYAWNTLEVLAMNSGNVNEPVNAIPASAEAVLQLRYVVGTDIDEFEQKLRKILDQAGYPMISIEILGAFPASRTDPDNQWVEWARASVANTMGQNPAVLPNFGGSLPNRVFAEGLGLPTVWIPHSYPGCLQHAPNEHVLEPIMREGLQIMTGLFYDLADTDPDLPNGEPVSTAMTTASR